MAGQAGSHRAGKFRVTVAQDGAVQVSRGDTISGFCAAIYGIPVGKTESKWGEFGRLAGSQVVPLANAHKIKAGETLYHIPTWRENRPKPQIKRAKITRPPKPVPTKATEKLIAYENRVDAASDTKGAYDLYLYEDASGDMRLVVFMKVQFYFENSILHKWRTDEKKAFVRKWVALVKGSWGNRVIRILRNGQRVRLDFKFETQIGGFMYDHWELTVRKIRKGGFRTSSISPRSHEGDLDSEDLRPSSKGCSKPQLPAVHEFGHMMGLNDEYESGHRYQSDCVSVMNGGMTFRPRHHSTLIKWVDQQLGI